MIQEYYENGRLSGIQLESSVPCRTLAGRDWKIILPTIQNSLVFIDEENDFLRTKEFAEAIRNSSNYYVIITRESLPYLPYSVNEIYGVRESGKYVGMKHVYNEFYRIYHPDNIGEISVVDTVIVEDTNSGYDFFSSLRIKGNPKVISSGGKAGILRVLLEHGSRNCLIVADGAAFGPEMERVMKQAKNSENVIIYLPESFEWLLLKSGLIDGNRIKDILEEPENHIESENHFSWERYFTSLLIEETKDSYLRYSKRRLNPVYLHKAECNAICKAMDKIEELFE